MQALLYWLRIGIATLVAFLPPVGELEEGAFTVRLETKALFTDAMKELLEHGLEIGFELQASLKVDRADGTEERTVRLVERRVRYDHLDAVYVLEQDGSPSTSYSTIVALERAAKSFPTIRFPLGGDWGRLSLLARLRILDNKVLSERLGIRAAELWRGYVPTVLKDWERQP